MGKEEHAFQVSGEALLVALQNALSREIREIEYEIAVFIYSFCSGNGCKFMEIGMFVPVGIQRQQVLSYLPFSA